jgi:hypothetical protein
MESKIVDIVVAAAMKAFMTISTAAQNVENG